MTQLLALTINQLRNLVDVDIEPGPRFNILYGNNGSGKTSFLEAIHYLGLGRSFRTRQHSRVINHNSDSCVIFTQLSHANSIIPIGLERSKQSNNQLKISGAACTLNSVADLLPIQLIHPDGHKLIASGPTYRRQYLDWGVFHVEHSFFPHWQRAQRALKQRNKLLKHHGTRYVDVESWDSELCVVSEKIHTAREKYVAMLLPVLESVLAMMELSFELTISYLPGWNSDIDLQSIMKADFHRDLRLSYTQHGVHKADLALKVANKPAHDVLSQGQQKMLVYAMTIAQSRLLTSLTKKKSIFLIDDLAAELDPHKRLRLTELLTEDQNQVFLTGIEAQSLTPFIEQSASRLFHVEHGKITRDNSWS